MIGSEIVWLYFKTARSLQDIVYFALSDLTTTAPSMSYFLNITGKNL